MIQDGFVCQKLNRYIDILLNVFLGPECRCLCNAKKRLEIYKLPKILIIQLKRYQKNIDK